MKEGICAFGQLIQANVLPSFSALSHPDLSISQLKGGWRKTAVFLIQGTEEEPPTPNPTLWVILALYAFNKSRFGPRNQATFTLNAA